MTRTEQLRAFIQKQMDQGVDNRAQITESVPRDIRDLYDTPASLTGAVNAMHGNMLRKARVTPQAQAVSDAPSGPAAPDTADTQDVDPEVMIQRLQEIQGQLADMRRGVLEWVAREGLTPTDILGATGQAEDDAADLVSVSKRLTKIEARLEALEGKPAANLWQQGFNDAKRFADALHTRVRNTVLPKTLR